MPNLFTSINLDADKTVASTFDYKVLDTVCNHQVLNEVVPFDAQTIFTTAVYSGTGIYGNGALYSGGIDPDASVIITTQMPLGATDVQFFELPNSSVTNPLIQEFTVPSDLTQTFRMAFPPVPNSTFAKLKTTSVDVDGETQVVYFDFANYSLSQLFGIIKFNSTSDIGSDVVFSYVGDIRQIFPKAKDYSPNWEFIGYNQKGQGVFRVFGRSFIATGSSLVIRYKTVAAACPRCGGTSLVTDLDFNNSKSQYYLVYDFSKMIQDFFKRFLTRRGSNIFDLTDGTQIPLYVGLGKNNPVLIDTLVRTEVINLVNIIRNKQAVQLTVQGLSLAEQIGQINQLVVTRDNITDVNVVIDMQSLSHGTAQLQTTVRGGA